MTHQHMHTKYVTPARRFKKYGIAVFFGTIVLPLAIGFTATKPAQAAQDAYLDAINAEGDRLEVLGQAKKEQELLMRSAPPSKESTKSKTAQKRQVKATPAPALSAAPTPSKATTSASSSVTNQEFEQALRKNFPGSFALYSLLEPKQQEAVFNEYEQSSSEGPARFLPVVTRIISFTTAKNRKR